MARDAEGNYKLFLKTMKECETWINAEYDVAGLCRAMPRRLAKLREKGGDRLRT